MVIRLKMVPSPDDRTLLSGQPVEATPGADRGSPPISETTTPLVRVRIMPPQAPVVPAAPRALGETDRFVEREVIGVGGMGSVIRAYDKHLHREVAIKMLNPECAPDGYEAQRFLEEARITGQLEHPYIVPVYEFGTDHRGVRFLSMRLVQGKTLEETLHAAGAGRLLPDRLGDLLQVFAKVCDAVSFAHSRGVIHRDLKPSNVMISDFGQVYVMDWGIARLAPKASEDGSVDTESVASSDPPGALIGTPSYMAPEQLRGENDLVDERTDVFALGATLYQILAGHPPRLPDSIHALVRNRTPVPIPLAQEVVKDGVVPPELSRIAERAMSTNASDRYASVDELKGDVERFLRGAWQLPKVRFRAGAIIVTAGDPGESAYVITEGRCLAYRGEGEDETLLREMGPGDVFGETAVFSKKPRTASVKAVTDVELMVVTSDLLSSALGLNGWMGVFVRALADRFREVDERLRQVEHPDKKIPTSR